MFVAPGGEGPSLDDAGYTEAEYTAAGTATSYTSAQDRSLPTACTSSSRRPRRTMSPGSSFAGRPTPCLQRHGRPEWLNVSAGADSSPDYTYLADELLAGVTPGSACRPSGWASRAATSRWPSRRRGRRPRPRAQEQRSGAVRVLRHPGDAFSYDIFTQVGRALRSPGPWTRSKGLDVQQLLAVGESQSAFALTTYINGVQPLTGLFDGFLVHSRGRSAAPLGDPDEGLNIAAVFGGDATTIRTDGEAPVIVVETETDVVGLLAYLQARQPDDDRFRLWEIAGTAHADLFQIGERAETLGCPQPINNGQQVFVLRAALRHLPRWATDGTAPPEADRLDGGRHRVVAHPPARRCRQRPRWCADAVLDAPVDRLTGFAAGIADRLHPERLHHTPERGAARRPVHLARRLPQPVRGGDRRDDRGRASRSRTTATRCSAAPTLTASEPLFGARGQIEPTCRRSDRGV